MASSDGKLKVVIRATNPDGTEVEFGVVTASLSLESSFHPVKEVPIEPGQYKAVAYEKSASFTLKGQIEPSGVKFLNWMVGFDQGLMVPTEPDELDAEGNPISFAKPTVEQKPTVKKKIGAHGAIYVSVVDALL